jgi:Flp pilus assembly protein TadG
MQGIGSRYFRLVGRFARNSQIALLFALGAIPVLIAASIAQDMSNASNLRSKLQAAADAAVLARATRLAVGADDADKEDLMLKITGNGDVGATVSQFAILADTIAIEGNGQLNIKIGQNYQDQGLPDLPEAHEVVRLLE